MRFAMASLNGTPMNGTPMNGTPMNGTPMNGTPMNGTGALPSTQSVDWAPTAGDDAVAERARLEAEIVVVTARAAAARQRAAQRDLDVRAALREELTASKSVLAEMERAHEVTVAMLREAAQAEVDRILRDARARSANERAASSGVHQELEVNRVE
ncbi:MAG: hypothetical protein WCC60_07595 [Ilumatobacteraceae bacterium]